jgi:hypothetical protein
MIELFKAMTTMQQIYWIAAILSSVIFVIQAISTFLGFDSDSDFSGGDVNFDADGFSLISVKTVVCFVLGFGWTGVLFADQIADPLWLGLLASGVGVLFMLLIALLLRQMMRLSHDNSFHTTMAVGKIAEVYLHIPAERADSGKVMVSVDGSMHELSAMTSGTESFPTGARVRIVGTIDEETVLVEAITDNP